VTQPTARVPLPGDRLRGRGGPLELPVHPVHELLLPSDLALGDSL
jgi:hypothetical protein